MKLVERMFDNAWYIASREQVPRQQIQEECRRALQSHREAAAALQRARAVSPPSPSAVAVALSHTNSSQAALNRARARAEAAERCTHVVHGHAFNVRDVLGATGAPEVAVASCTLERTATLVPPGDERIWTARLTDPAQRYRGPLSVHLTDDAQESFEMVCRWIVTGHL